MAVIEVIAKSGILCLSYGFRLWPVANVYGNFDDSFNDSGIAINQRCV